VDISNALRHPNGRDPATEASVARDTIRTLTTQLADAHDRNRQLSDRLASAEKEIVLLKDSVAQAWRMTAWGGRRPPESEAPS
jgi:predicted  nucleic acid-binding Zn-ribbon protein